MSFKVRMRVIVAMSVITISLQQSAFAYSGRTCTLKEMRELAANACMHIGLRDKREISNDLINSWDAPKVVSAHNADLRFSKGVRLRRKDFPEGGYLIVAHKYAKILSQRTRKPKYHVMDWHFRKSADRIKRHDDEGISVTYCCMHKCSPLDFCLAN